MKKNVKGFTVEDWVIGENTDSCFRIQVTSVIEPIGQNVNTLAEATAKIKYLDQQYFHVIERNKALEEQLYNSQCQIRALQASNVYISEEILEETVEKELQIITEEIIQKHSDDTENKQALTKQIYFQKLIIDELMCKIQNMHHRIEYYKDDVTDLKTQCEKEKVTIEVEKKDKKVVREQYEKALQTIEKLNEDIEKQNIQIQEIYNNREVQTKLVIEKTDYQVDAELYLNEFKAKDQLGRVARLYNEKLQEVQLKNQIIVETLGLCMKKKIDELRNFYEYRIAQMVKEYSFEEGKFYSIILRLKSEISEHMQNVHSLDQTAKMVTSRFTLDRQRSLKAESTIKNLNDLLDKISFKAIESSSHDKAEIESIMKHSEEVEEDIKNQYKLQQRIAEKEHMEAMNILTHSYTLKINKINDEFKFWEKKIQEKGQSQHNVLLQEISRLETEKTEIEMQTAARVQAVVREANSRYQEYENLIDFSKKQLLEQWHNDRRKIEFEHNEEIKKINKAHEEAVSEKVASMEKHFENKIEKIEIIHNERTKEIARKNHENIIHIKSKNLKKIREINQQIERLNTENLKILKRIDELNSENDKNKLQFELDLQSSKEKIEDQMKLYNDLLGLKQKMQIDFEERLSRLRHDLSEKDAVLRLRYETEKKLAVGHILQDKNDLESMYQKKVSELAKKIESLSTKYNSSKQKTNVLRFSDTNSQKQAKELYEKDKIIDQLRRERSSLQASLDYMNSTVKIFSTQEKVIHAKSNSYELKTPKSMGKTAKLSGSVRFN